MELEYFQNEEALNRDLAYLENLVLSLSSEELFKTILEENWYLWKEKGKCEDLILKELYNIEYNFRAYAYEVAICRRISVLRALNKLCGRSLISLSQAFRISSPIPLIEELIKPVTKETLELMGEPLERFGRGNISELAKSPGSMKCICTDEHDQVLFHWLKSREEGFLNSDHILLHFDAHSDMTSISENDMSILSGIKSAEDLKNYIATFYSSSEGNNLITPVNLVSFIYYAVKKKLVREIFWVYPTPDYCKYRFPANLERAYLFDIDEAKDFRLENRHIVCDWAGVKVHILTIEELPVFSEEVILDIDMDFFLNRSSAESRNGARGYRLWNREDLKAWKSICNYSVRFGSLVPWITPENFFKFIKTKKYFFSSYYHSIISFFYSSFISFFKRYY